MALIRARTAEADAIAEDRVGVRHDDRPPQVVRDHVERRTEQVGRGLGDLITARESARTPS